MFVLSILALSAPLILACMGGFVSERGGVINIALEGKMLAAAVVTALAGAATGNAWIGLAAGIGASVLMAWLDWLLTQGYRMDQVVSGMAINLLAWGVANFLDKRFTNPTAGALPSINLWWYEAAALASPVVLALHLKWTRGGLRLKAIGSDPSKARQMGLAPSKIRFVALTITGLLCGLSGALIVSNAGYYADNMTAGRGFIALAALILGGWKPLPAMFACLLFGAFQSLQIYLQGTSILGAQLPREVWYSLPYLVTVVALAGFMGNRKAPAGLGKL